MSEKIDGMQSTAIWNMKAFAVVAIVACHCCHVSESAGMINQLTTKFLDYWIGYGVPVFYFLSGYLFQCDRKGIFSFMRKKAVSVIIPWIVTGTAVWLYVVLRKGGISWDNWFGYLFMRESYLYFLSNLVLYFLLFYYVKKYKVLRYIVSLYFSVGVLLQMGLGIEIWMPLSVLELPLSYTLYFYIGILAREYKCLQRFGETRYSFALVGFVAVRYLQIYEFVPVEIGMIVGILGTVLLIVGLYSVSYWIAEKRIKWVTTLGKNSFSLYLLHMPAAGVTAWALNKSEVFALLTVWRPAIVILITMGLIMIYEKIARNNRFCLMMIGKR